MAFVDEQRSLFKGTWVWRRCGASRPVKIKRRSRDGEEAEPSAMGCHWAIGRLGEDGTVPDERGAREGEREGETGECEGEGKVRNDRISLMTAPTLCIWQSAVWYAPRSRAESWVFIRLSFFARILGNAYVP